MRTRVAILMVAPALALVAALGGCSEDSNSSDSTPTADGADAPSAPTTDFTNLDCARFAGTSSKIADAQQKLYGSDAAARAEAIDTLAGELTALKDGAPDDVDEALDVLSEGFREAAAIVADPANADPSKLASLAPRLSEAGQKVTTYIAEECAG